MSFMWAIAFRSQEWYAKIELLYFDSSCYFLKAMVTTMAVSYPFEGLYKAIFTNPSA